MKTYYIDSINKTINLAFAYDKDIIKEVKECHKNARWNPELEVWVIPVDSWSAPLVASLVKGRSFKCIEVKEVEDVKVDYTRTEVDMAYLKGKCDAMDFAYTPRQYQLEALAYGMEKGNMINGDDVGLGKTFESIMHAETTNSFPCIVIVPASVKYNWKEKWEEITKGKREIAVIESKETKKRKNNWDADVVVINYDIIGKKHAKGATVRFEQLLDVDWKMVICDEGHFLKNKKSQRSIAAKKIMKGDKTIHLLTGTATMSKPSELWNLLVLIKRDHLIASDWHQFIRRYCGGYQGKYGWVTDGATNTIELNQRLRDNCYIRREKRDVLDELPDIVKQVIEVPITNKKDIDKATTNFIEYIKELKGQEAAEKAMEAEHLVALGALRKLAMEGKLKAVEQYLKDWKESGIKLVVFGVHREPLDYLSEKFKCPLIAGGVSAKKKQQIVNDWIESDDIFLFANMISAGTGVDGLQKICSNMVILELPWRPSDLHQVHGRLERSGQKDSINVTYLLNDCTIDKQMWEMLEEKELVTEAVNKGIDIRRNQSGLRAVMRKIVKTFG